MMQPKVALLDRPPGQEPVEFLFIVYDYVIGRLWADCAVCAWREGHALWPNAKMACWAHVDPDERECIHVTNARRKQERRND